MRCSEAERLRQGHRPAVFGVAGKCIDQIEADAPEVLLRNLERLPSFPRRMRSPEEAERLVIEALESEREPVHARGSEIGEARRLDRIWIGFERDLNVLRRRPELECLLN